MWSKFQHLIFWDVFLGSQATFKIWKMINSSKYSRGQTPVYNFMIALEFQMCLKKICILIFIN